MNKITISEVLKKHLKIVAYLLVSGAGGYLLAELAKRPELMMVFGGALNYLLWNLEKELKNENIRAALQ